MNLVSRTEVEFTSIKLQFFIKFLRNQNLMEKLNLFSPRIIGPRKHLLTDFHVSTTYFYRIFMSSNTHFV